MRFQLFSGTNPRLKNPNHKWNNLSGIAAAASVSIINPYFPKLVERLGGGDIELAYLHSLPALFSLFALIPGAILIDIVGKRRATTIFMASHKLFYIMMGLLPFLPDTMPRALIFACLVAAMNLPGAIYANGYNSSLADLFLVEERGAALSLKSRYSEITRLLVTAISGYLMSLPNNNGEAILLYQIFFVVAFLIGILEVAAFRQFQFPRIEAPRMKWNEIWGAIRQSFHFAVTDKAFKKYVVVSLLFYFGWQMGWPLFSIYQVKVLKASEAWFSIYSIAAAITSIVGSTIWMKILDKIPANLAIITATFGMSLTPVIYVFCTTLESLIIANVISGFFIVGTSVSLTMLILAYTPSENRTTIMSIHATLVAISQSFIPVLSVKVVEITNLTTAFYVSGAMRFVGCLAFVYLYFDYKRSQHQI